ncbi:MAG: polysaccharide deacetylase family protein [Lachnospiraceae bacterium]
MLNNIRKWIIGCGFISLAVGLWFMWLHFGHSFTYNGGLHQNGKVGLVTEEKNGKITEESTKNKDADETKKERVIQDNTDYSLIDNTMYSWWFKRNENHEQSGCQEDFDIKELNGYYLVPVNKKIIYLTFDCGYENGYTNDILDILKKEKVTAAFFVTQTFIRDNVELVKRMKQEGHLVCNHSVTHPCMPSKTIAEQKEEILTCERYMKEATGYEMDLFFRPPRGEYSKRTLQVAKDLGYTTVFWSIAYLDYDVNNQPSQEHVVGHFQKYYHPGAIPLLHNVSKANHDALPEVIKNLKKEGYSFGDLYDLTKNQS